MWRWQVHVFLSEFRVADAKHWLPVGSAPFDEAAALRLREIMFAAVTAAAINVSRAGCDPPTAPELQQVVAARR
ncbi:hypothetical protein AK812_SmicGene5558 [Symbiodinium microadriaticum]|uniref:Uncharacterized protein n=1 Tax=Symbiodinium microadriaticum TaxID=2951 RepID=A0A1Q9ETJ2_SYMMI|nr:hypothetical protein AK812_SmicGene5558 [Symbiodinium microadriaticum]